jgi:flagellar hook-basal body complex protein FliE
MPAIPSIGIGTFLPLQGNKAAENLLESQAGANATAKVGNENFGNVITRALDGVQNLQETTNELSVKAATGDLTDIHDYTIAAQQSSLAMDLTLAVRNKALEAYQEVMRMQV